MVAIDISVQGSKEVKQGLERGASQIRDMRPVYEQIHRDFQQQEAKAFTRGGSPEKWVPLTPHYAAWKRRHFPGRPTLVLTGQLRESLTGRNRYTVVKIGPREALFSTTHPVAHLHQRGAGKRVPSRKIVQITNATKNRWRTMIRDWVQATLKGALAGEGRLMVRTRASGILVRHKKKS